VLDFEEADPETDVFGIGKVEDLTWKGMLDLAPAPSAAAASPSARPG